MADRVITKPHALILPVPSHSHLVNLLALASKLAKNGITITVAGFKRTISSIKVEYAKEVEAHEFNLLELEHDPGNVDFVNVKPEHVIAGLQLGFVAAVEKFESDRAAGMSIPTCIIADLFLNWTEDAAVRLGIQRYDFLASGVNLARLYNDVPRLIEQGAVKLSENNSILPFDGFLQVQDVANLRFSDLPYSLLALMDMVMTFVQTTSRPLVVNSFYELESRVIDGLALVRKIIPIGPIDTARVDENDESREEPRSELLDWLDTQPEASVIYICLGSMVRLDPPQIMQLALALESSNDCRFLWALKQRDSNPKPLADVLPPDFQTKMKGRGLVTSSWAPQVQILKHPATAGFLSHCGWGSTVESLSSGVPMIGWPHYAEQYLNCRYLVDGLKVAMEVLRGTDDLVDQNEFRKVFALMMGDHGKDLRDKCKLIKVHATAAVAPGGSSEKAFLELVEDIKVLN